MCGRYASFRQAQDLADSFDVTAITPEADSVHPSFNVAPTDEIRIVLGRDDDDSGSGLIRQMVAARWGLIPASAKDPSAGARMINARVETVAEKSSFAEALRTRRCVLPADGYYEWQKNGDGKKTPHYIYRADSAPLVFAGLYAFWRDPTRDDDDPLRWVLSTTILTRPARADLARIHDREPVVLRRKSIAQWLDPEVTTPDDALTAIRPERPRLAFHRVDARVGNVRNDSSDLIEPVD